jgi:FtsH-binding integral membrane protein
MEPVSRHQQSYGAGTRAQGAAVDAGLRAHMLKVYNYMTVALVLTGAIAWYAFRASVAGYAADGTPVFTSFGQTIYASPLAFVIMLAPLAFVLVLSFGIHRLSTLNAQMLFWAFASVMGLSLSSIFIVYTGDSIARVFFITAATFGAMSLYGYTTKRDLSGLGAFLFMGLIGLIIAMIVNIFMQSSVMAFAISVIGVGIFVGLTAYDTQAIKNLYLGSRENEDTVSKLAVMGALRLYLDFINLFLMLLRLLGNRN